jgi:hypothetical protein
MDYVRQTYRDQKKELKKLWNNKRDLAFQALNLGLIVFSALLAWKALMAFTESESPVVVVLSGSMEPLIDRGKSASCSLVASRLWSTHAPCVCVQVPLVSATTLQHLVQLCATLARHTRLLGILCLNALTHSLVQLEAYSRARIAPTIHPSMYLFPGVTFGRNHTNNI